MAVCKVIEINEIVSCKQDKKKCNTNETKTKKKWL